jgi:hypothetical protein
VASGPYLKNTTNYSPAMTFSFTPDAKLINVKIPTLSRAKFVQKIQAVFKETSRVFKMPKTPE